MGERTAAAAVPGGTPGSPQATQGSLGVLRGGPGGPRGPSGDLGRSRGMNGGPGGASRVRQNVKI